MLSFGACPIHFWGAYIFFCPPNVNKASKKMRYWYMPNIWTKWKKSDQVAFLIFWKLLAWSPTFVTPTPIVYLCNIILKADGWGLDFRLWSFEHVTIRLWFINIHIDLQIHHDNDYVWLLLCNLWSLVISLFFSFFFS